MSERVGFTYVPLRFFPDVTTGEFVNVGIVVFSPDVAFFGGAFSVPVHRLKALAPTVNEWAVQESVNAIADWVAHTRAKVARSGVPRGFQTVLQLARGALPSDDSGLQWGPIGSGTANDMQVELRHLFNHFVIRRGESEGRSRPDDAVWLRFRDQFQRLRLIELMEPVRLSAHGNVLDLQYTIRHSRRHCFVPVSLDWPTAEVLREHAYAVLGRFAAVRATTEPHHVHFLVGMPASPALRDAAQEALRILHACPFENESVSEDLAEEFVERVAPELRMRFRSTGAGRL